MSLLFSPNMSSTKPNLQTIFTNLKQFNCVTSIKIVVESQNFQVALALSQYKIKQFQTKIDTKVSIQKGSFFSALGNNFQILPSRKVIIQLDEIDKQYSPLSFSNNIAILDLTNVDENKRFCEIYNNQIIRSNQMLNGSQQIELKFKKEQINCSKQSVNNLNDAVRLIRQASFSESKEQELIKFSVKDIVLNGKDLYEIINILIEAQLFFYFTFQTGGILGQKAKECNVNYSCYGLHNEFLVEVEDVIDI